MGIGTRMTKSRKGFMFTFDAVLAATLLIGGLLIISHHLVSEHPKENLEYITMDVLSTLSELNMSEIDSSFRTINLSNSADVNISVLEQIGTYWAKGETTYSTSLASQVLSNILPSGMGFNLSMQGNVSVAEHVLFNQSQLEVTNLVVGQRMITGIVNGSPLTGSTSSAYLRRVDDKRTSSFVYFGGFIGQGNITALFNLGNVSITNIKLEMDVALGSNFSLIINGGQCNTSTGEPIFNGQTPNLVADTWNITNCQGLMREGQNNITFIFMNISSAYIQGGYLKIMYTTDEFQENSITNTGITNIPGIDGVVNLYDSFYVPGNLSNLAIYLHYKVNTSGNTNNFYMTIGNTTIFYDNTTIGENTVTYTDANLIMLDYETLSQSTVPIRIGFENLTFETIITNASGFGDVVLTTDLSTSMDADFNGDSGTDRSCSNPLLFDPTTEKVAVAKCLDKNFTRDILRNNSLNRVALAPYSTTTISIIGLTNDLTQLNNSINGYAANGNTCTACSVVDSIYLFTTQLNTDTWKYWADSQFSSSPASWNQISFDDSLWPSGNTPFGYNVAGVVTTLNKTAPVYANLWENNGDVSGPPADFSSGTLNTTGNTYGWNAGNDGWDWKTGAYGGNSTNVSIDGLYSLGGDYKLRIFIGGSPADGTRHISDGSYGIQFNVTQEMYNIIQNGGIANFSFKWNWTGCSKCNNTKANDSSIWIKARITNTTNGTIYLGSILDFAKDNTNDVFWTNKTNTSYSNYSSYNITSYIKAPGIYYLDFGGKFNRNMTNRNGTFYFDDTQLNFSTNNIGKTYYRNTFQIENISNLSNAVLYVASNNNALVYINGIMVDNDTKSHTYSNWNRFVNAQGYLQAGSNVIAVQLNNNDSSSGFFDLELRANVGNRQNALVIMSDGGASYCVTAWNGTESSNNCNECGGRACCPNSLTGQLNETCPDYASLDGGSSFNVYGWERPIEQLYNISCYLNNKYNIGIFAVAFGSGLSDDGIKSLNMSAACDNATHFYNANNVSGLSNIYQSIASSILSGFLATQSQVILFSGGSFAPSTLYPDSYISYNFTPIVSPATPDEIEVVFESPKFTDCDPQVNIPSGLRVVDAKIVSYSGIHWTDYLNVNGNEAYDLSEYNPSYVRLGDPFIVQIPPNYLIPGLNDFILKTGDDPITNTNCSSNNSFIYTAFVSSSTARSPVVEHAIGCNWTIQFEDDTFSNKKIPATYSGSNICNYTANDHSITPVIENDAYNLAVYNMLKLLDLGDNGKVFVNLEATDIEIVITTVSSVPYLWGPTIVKAMVWQ